MLNNKGPDPVEVRPTLFSLNGNRLDAPPITVPGESFQNVDLSELGAVPGSLFEEGSLQLFHKGPDLVIGAQLYIVDESRSLSLDEKLAEFQGAPSTQLESVWWMPPHSNADLILSNTSDAEVIAHVRGVAEPTTLTLAAHETRKIRVNQEHGRANAKSCGSASITHSGPKGALVARVLTTDKGSGYSFSSQFYYPQGAKSAGYQGVGLRLEDVANQHLQALAIARNVGEAPSQLTGRVTYTTTTGDTGVVQLPPQNLNPGEVVLLDVDRFTRRVVEQQSIATAGLEFEYSTAPGSVIMVAQSVSRDGNQVFRVPMWDVPAQRNGTGGYPWFIEGNSSTFVYIKNVTDKEQEYTFALTYPRGGEYSTGVKKLKPKQSTVFDIRAMRDHQVPDEKGNVISSSASRGKIVWSVRGRDPLALLGRSEQVDAAKGISSSYACFMCCPNSFRMSWVEPFSLYIPVGNLTTARGVERDQTCYGSLTSSYYYGDTWTVDDSNVLSADGTGSTVDVTAVGVGSGTLTGHWDVYSFTMEHEDGIPFCVESSGTTEPTSQTAVCTRPTGETTTFGGWADSESLPTIGKWNQTLLPSTTNFVGRTVTEQDPGGGGPDNCWFQNSAIPQITSITGGSWTVTSGNAWGSDYAGLSPDVVTYYRNQGRDPCSVTIPQRMVINCQSGTVVYRSNTLGYVIDNPKVTSIRDGQSAERTWP